MILIKWEIKGKYHLIRWWIKEKWTEYFFLGYSAYVLGLGMHVNCLPLLPWFYWRTSETLNPVGLQRQYKECQFHHRHSVLEADAEAGTLGSLEMVNINNMVNKHDPGPIQRRF